MPWQCTLQTSTWHQNTSASEQLNRLHWREMRSFLVAVALLGLAYSAPSGEGMNDWTWYYWHGDWWEIKVCHCTVQSTVWLFQFAAMPLPALVISHASSWFPYFISSWFAYRHHSSPAETYLGRARKPLTFPRPLTPARGFSLFPPFHSDCCRQCENNCSCDSISRNSRRSSLSFSFKEP